MADEPLLTREDLESLVTLRRSNAIDQLDMGPHWICSVHIYIRRAASIHQTRWKTEVEAQRQNEWVINEILASPRIQADILRQFAEDAMS